MHNQTPFLSIAYLLLTYCLAIATKPHADILWPNSYLIHTSLA